MNLDLFDDFITTLDERIKEVETDVTWNNLLVEIFATMNDEHAEVVRKDIAAMNEAHGTKTNVEISYLSETVLLRVLRAYQSQQFMTKQRPPIMEMPPAVASAYLTMDDMDFYEVVQRDEDGNIKNFMYLDGPCRNQDCGFIFPHNFFDHCPQCGQ